MISHLYLAEAHELLLCLTTNYQNVDNDHKRQAVQVMPALIRAHGLAATLAVWQTQGAPESAKAEKHMRRDLAVRVGDFVNKAAVHQSCFTARRTQTALALLDAAAALLDGVIPKPAPPRPVSNRQRTAGGAA